LRQLGWEVMMHPP